MSEPEKNPPTDLGSDRKPADDELQERLTDNSDVSSNVRLESYEQLVALGGSAPDLGDIPRRKPD